MTAVNSYILDARVQALMLNDTTCIQCERPLTIGDAVVTKRGGSGKRRMYCKPCAVDLNILEDEH